MGNWNEETLLCIHDSGSGRLCFSICAIYSFPLFVAVWRLSRHAQARRFFPWGDWFLDLGGTLQFTLFPHTTRAQVSSQLAFMVTIYQYPRLFRSHQIEVIEVF
jgi:hypothetical protein